MEISRLQPSSEFEFRFSKTSVFCILNFACAVIKLLDHILSQTTKMQMCERMHLSNWMQVQKQSSRRAEFCSGLQ